MAIVLTDLVLAFRFAAHDVASYLTFYRANAVAGVLIALLPSALFGLLAGLLAVGRESRLAERAYFGLAVLFGLIAWWVTTLLGSLNRLSCIEICDSAAPSEQQLVVISAVVFVLSAVPPAVLLLRPRRKPD